MSLVLVKSGQPAAVGVLLSVAVAAAAAVVTAAENAVAVAVAVAAVAVIVAVTAVVATKKLPKTSFCAGVVLPQHRRSFCTLGAVNEF